MTLRNQTEYSANKLNRLKTLGVQTENLHQSWTSILQNTFDLIELILCIWGFCILNYDISERLSQCRLACFSISKYRNQWLYPGKIATGKETDNQYFSLRLSEVFSMFPFLHVYKTKIYMQNFKCQAKWGLGIYLGKLFY